MNKNGKWLKRRCARVVLKTDFAQTHSPITTLMKLLMLVSLSLWKFTRSTVAPALLGLNWTLALASCLGPTSPILQETCMRRDTSLSEINSAGTKVNNRAHLSVTGLPSVRPAPSMVKLQSFSSSGKEFTKVSSAVSSCFTLASPTSCRQVRISDVIIWERMPLSCNTAIDTLEWSNCENKTGSNGTLLSYLVTRNTAEMALSSAFKWLWTWCLQHLYETSDGLGQRFSAGQN